MTYRFRWKLRHLNQIGRWLRTRRVDPFLLTAYEFFASEAPVRMERARVLGRVRELEAALSHTTRGHPPPALVTIARSNIGGYTPLEHTPMIEEAVASMLRRLYPTLRHVEYRPAGPTPAGGVLNASDHRALARMIAEARRTAGGQGARGPAPAPAPATAQGQQDVWQQGV